MTRFRLARPAQADLKQILATSGERWGDESRRRYAAILVAAMRHVAADPEGTIAFYSDRGGDFDVWQIDANGSGLRALPGLHPATIP